MSWEIAARVKVKVQDDPTFDFRPIKTWSWHPDGAGSVRMALTKDDDPDALKRRIEPTIVDAVASVLKNKGLLPAPTGTPADVQVSYFALISMGTSAQQLGQFLPPVAYWGLPPFEAATQSLRIYESGSLVLDVSAPSANGVVWRGIAQAEIERQRTEEQRRRRLQEAVGDLLKKFPPTRKPKPAPKAG